MYYFENPFICKWQKNVMHQNRKDEHYVHAYYFGYSIIRISKRNVCVREYHVEDENGGEFHKKVFISGFLYNNK